MTLESLLVALQDRDVMLPLLLSLVAGALVGIEREFRSRPAGVRTHTLVCFASALMTLLGLRMGEWTAVFPSGTQIVTDMARMPHAILTGMGFLGAGVIFREGATVQGLTTAASLWLTAALGIVFGAGLEELAVIGTAIALVVLALLRLFQRLTPPKPELCLEVTVAADSGCDGAALASALAGEGVQVSSVSVRQDRASGLRRYTLLAAGGDHTIDCDRILRALEGEAVHELSVAPLAGGLGAGRVSPPPGESRRAD